MSTEDTTRVDMNDTDVNDQQEHSTDMHAATEDIASSGPSDEELQKSRQELEAQKDKYLRLVAEFENFKRRNARERIELMQTAGKEVITSLLDVLDDMDRAEKQMQTNEDANQLKEGVLLVFNKLRNALQSKGLKPMTSIDN